MFNSIFGQHDNPSSSSKLNWILLKDLGQLNEIITISHENPS